MNGRNKTTTQTLRRPSGQGPMTGRGIAIILLTLVLPPVGLLVMWQRGMFQARGRMLLTTLATVEMAVLGVLLTPRAELASQTPLPVAPVAVTQAPAEENLTALYNIESLLYEQQLAQVIAEGGEEEDIMTDDQLEAKKAAEREEILNTTVYAVFRNASRYHAQMVCGTQSNGRALTVREAMLEALSPCPDCNPPVWTE
ncbi:MAG: hypothetical protein IJ646_07275 [Clostridia bacterium]|nr:hypothetical protein [Clostridia bacterium]